MRYQTEGTQIYEFYSAIEQRAVEWLWYPYIPYGKIYQCSIVDVVKYALFYFITDEHYRKNNGYYAGMRRYGFVLTLLWPFANVAAYIARKKKKLK